MILATWVEIIYERRLKKVSKSLIVMLRPHLDHFSNPHLTLWTI